MQKEAYFMKKKTHKPNRTAAAIMVLSIVVSMPLGVNRSFTRLRDEVQGEYYYDSTGYAIWEGVDTCESCAKNMITVAKNYTEQNPELSKLIANLEYSTQVSENTYEFEDKTYTEIRDAVTDMVNDARALYDALQEVELSEKDAKYPRQLIADIDAECDKMARSSYNEEAQSYNEKLSMFPASELRKIARVDYMATFNDTESFSVPIVAEDSADLIE